MNFPHLLVILSACLIVLGSYRYIRDTLLGGTKPNRVSWFMWSLAPLIATAAAVSAGVNFWGVARIFLSGFLPLIILSATFFNKKSYWKLTFFDILCGIFSLLALVFWLYADSPRVSILLAVIADIFALLPTLHKAWKYPETETGITFSLGIVASLLVLPSIPVWDIQNSAFSIYLLIANTLLVISIYRKKLIK